MIIGSSSCWDESKHIAKRELQKVEIARLTEELARLKGKIENKPPDVSAELKEVRERATRQSAEIKQLEGEIAGLAERKQSLRAEMDAYREKYPIK